MPSKPMRLCKQPGCNALVVSGEGYCDKHKKQRQKQSDERRGSSSGRGYGGRWQKYRIVFLGDNPLCVECLKNNDLTPATVVDHIIPHKGDYDLFWDEDNHQALCKRCHDIKTATEDGGFGR